MPDTIITVIDDPHSSVETPLNIAKQSTVNSIVLIILFILYPYLTNKLTINVN